MKRSFILALGLMTITAGASPLTVGQAIPSVPLKTADGQAFDLQAAAKEQPLAVIFYRGGWCPFCNAHLAELQEAQIQLKELGFRIVAISPDRPEELQKSTEKSHLSYTLLSDSSMEAAKAFGLAFEVDGPMLEKLASYNIDIEAASGEKHHLLPIPAVFLVGADGVITFSHSNPDYTVRLSSAELLTAAGAVE